MSRAKMTSGPWHTGDSDWRRIVGSDTRHRTVGNLHYLASIAYIDTSDNETEDIANARAIACLPEAIERLEWLVANLENVAAHPETYPNLHAEVMKGRRILARIDGEEA